MIGRLKDHELERGMRRLMYSGAAAPPSLPQFVRLCRTVGDAPDLDEGPRVPALPKPAEWQGDRWDVAANRHLVAHLLRELWANPRAYGHPASVHAMRTMSREQFPNADASPEFVRAVRTLVAYTRAWAQDMREMAAESGGVVPVELQRAAWEDCMARAEADIAMQRRAARGPCPEVA